MKKDVITYRLIGRARGGHQASHSASRPAASCTDQEVEIQKTTVGAAASVTAKTRPEGSQEARNGMGCHHHL